AGWVYNTEINDLFLTVLSLALNEWSGNEKVLINLEGHGREAIIEDIDFSRTVGWFTTQYPVLFDMKPFPGESATVVAEEKVARQIRRVKETLRRIPNKGIGYGILKYLTSPENKEGTIFKLHPEVSFNYLGQLTEDSGDGGRKFNLDIELSASPDCDTSYAIDINGSAGSDGLSFSFAYDTYRFDEESVEAFVNCFKSNLLNVISHCVEMKKKIAAQGMTSIDYHVQKDYDKYRERIAREEWPDSPGGKDYRHILLSGGTGFLGGHMLAELLKITDAHLYLPIRGASQDAAEERFKKKVAFYFGDDFYSTHKDRLTVMRADLSEERLGIEKEQYDKLVEVVDAVVHPAANVKHFGSYEGLYKDNVVATEKLLELAATGKKKDFHFVSTLSVGDGVIPGRDYVLFTEYCNDIGMELEQIYLKSKMEAEKRVLEYRKKGINGSIYRVGNLIYHSDTGKFQENIGDDYFYNIIKGAVKLELLSDQMKTMFFDLSFINYTARSCALLLTTKGLKNEMYHVLNPNVLPMPEMAVFLRE
ncbi:MAG: NAD-dependent epimerase/dehydratase family protein, partial [bacterium]|nr:NAD-dependent epimerase/dehydratase family protein [bacterium]